MKDCKYNNAGYFATIGILIVVIIHVTLKYSIPKASLFTANKQTTGGTLTPNTGHGTGGYTGNLGGSIPIDPGNPGAPPFILTSDQSNIISGLMETVNTPEQTYNDTPQNRDYSSDFWFYYL